MKFAPPFPILRRLREDYIRSELTYYRGQHLYENEMCTMLTAEELRFTFLVEDRFEDFEVMISLAASSLSHECSCISRLHCCQHAAAALIHLDEHFKRQRRAATADDGETYTREEMITRVLREREERADQESFQFTFADNVFGIHEVLTAGGRRYRISFRDFSTRNGYCSCPDFRTGKLSTCKHLIAARKEIFVRLPVDKLAETQPYPFVEVYCDPLKDYHITYFHRGNMTLHVAALINKYFRGNRHVLPEKYPEFVTFLKEAREIKKILVRPEVRERIDRHFENVLYRQLAANHSLDFRFLKGRLYPFQEEGVRFAAYKRGVIIADEMGLGKTVQAIAVALAKKEMFGLRRALVICPTSLKHQWLQEIRKFSDADAAIISGTSAQREEMYRSPAGFFMIINYETAVRDAAILAKNAPEMIILDEAQRIRNYSTRTSHAVKSIPKQHSLVLTGTPVQHRLGDLYSIMNFIDPQILAPLWEFSMNHCYFDPKRRERITGYHHLDQLSERLQPWLIRREKREVLNQLPPIQEIRVPLAMHPEQQKLHRRYAKSLAAILSRRHLTGYDLEQMRGILTQMRMVCDSTHLVDLSTNISPKLDELEEILLEKLDILTHERKIIIFSEWKEMLRLIEKMLSLHRVGALRLDSDQPAGTLERIVSSFEADRNCRVLLASESMAADFNLTAADTLVNFDLPWKAAQREQRIRTVHRPGRKGKHLTVIDLVAGGSIEERIAEGITIEPGLFDTLLINGEMTAEIDLASGGFASLVQDVQRLTEGHAEGGELEVPEPRVPRTRRKWGEQLSVFREETVEEPGPAAVEAAPEVRAQAEPEPEPGSPSLDDVLDRGLQFINGLMKITTGKEISGEGRAIDIDPESGEVTLRFKLPPS